MFSDWSDPHDIDNYFEDISSLMKDLSAPRFTSDKTAAVVPSTQLSGVEVLPEEPTPSTIIAVPGEERTSGLIVGPQKPKEPFSNDCHYDCAVANEVWHNQIDWTHILLVMAFVLLAFMFLQVKSQLYRTNTIMQMLMTMHRSTLVQTKS